MSKKISTGLTEALSGEMIGETPKAPPPPPAAKVEIPRGEKRVQLDANAREVFSGSLSKPAEAKAQEHIAEATPEEEAKPAPSVAAIRPRTRVKPEVENIFIRAPKEVAERFNDLLEEHNFKAKWDGLVLLLDLYDQIKKSEK